MIRLMEKILPAVQEPFQNRLKLLMEESRLTTWNV